MKKKYFIYGEDISLVNNRAAQISALLTEKYPSYERRTYVCGEDDLTDIKSYIASLSMFSKGKTVLIENIENDSKNIDYLIKEIITPSSDVFLILTCGDIKIKKINTIKKLFSDKDSDFIRVYNLSARAVDAEIKKIISETGVKINKDALAALTRIFNYAKTNYYQISTSIENLINYAGGQTITLQAVKDIVGLDFNFNIFELRDALFRKETAKTLLLMGKNTQKIQDFLQHAVFWIIRTAGNIARLKEMKKQGKTKDKIISELKIMDFEYSNLSEMSANFSLQELKEIIFSAYIIQRDFYSVKASALMPRFEGLALKITAKRREHA